MGAMVISDIRGQTSVYDANFTADVVEKVLRAGGDQPPMIILPVNGFTLDRIKSRIESAAVPASRKAQWLAALNPIEDASFTWQQDLMQPYFDPAKGNVVLRQLAGYNDGRRDSLFQKIAQSGADCGFSVGAPLTGPELVDGMSGGNIEGLPGGVCALGSDAFSSEAAFDAYAENVCPGSPEDRLKVPTSWLAVGHTDEIMKVLPNPGQPPPCNFSIALASPQKALDLLKTNQNDFFDFSPAANENKTQTTTRRIRQSPALHQLCALHLEQLAKRRGPAPSSPRSRSGGQSWLRWLLRPELAQSSGSLGSSTGSTPAAQKENLDLCSQMSGQEAYSALIQNEDLRNYNKLVQDQMNQLKADLRQKLQRKLPQCQVDLIDVPNLFAGGAPVQGPNGLELPKKRGQSLLPNAANSISTGNTVISPDPGSEIFRKAMTEEYRKRGLQSEFVDTFDYGHLSGGNLHCVTNPIHICRPAGTP